MLLALALALSGCASTQVVLNQPLPSAEPNRVASLSRANAAGGRPDLLVLVSFSGGGKRSAAFGHGALRAMRGIPVPDGRGGTSPLIEEVDLLSGVSGGAFPAAHVALHGARSFETFPAEFLNQDINAYILGTFLLPWHWEWLVNPLYGTNDRMAEVYDRLMFRGATFADVAARRRPALSVNATDIAIGLPFGFTPGSFDLLCSDLGRFPLARAVAASNGFPGLFTPITLANHRGTGCLVPPPPRPDRAAMRADLRLRQLADTFDRYLDPERTEWVHLMDGGIADNLALRGILNALLVIEAEPESFAAALRPLRRILVISVDGQAATDPALSRRRVVGGLLEVFSAVSGTQIDNYNLETLSLAQSQIGRLVDRIRRLRCEEGPVVAGHACGDVEGLLLHVALADYPEEATRRRLQAIPTGLTIAPAFVDALVAAGERMVTEDAALRRFLAETVPGAAGPVAAAEPAAGGR